MSGPVFFDNVQYYDAVFCEWTLALTCESECHWKVRNNFKQYLPTSPDTYNTHYIVEHA